MGRIVVHENVSLDGVIQDPTGDEGFKFGGWFNQMPDDDRRDWAELEYQEALDSEAWLLGRGSYQFFAARWADKPGEWAERLRSIPKYIVSSTLDDASEWANSIVLKGDVIEEVTKVRQFALGDILVYASAPLVHTLLEHDLVDELRLMTHPVVLGTGDRLFRETSNPTPQRLVGVRAIGNSLALLTYQPIRSASN